VCYTQLADVTESGNLEQPESDCAKSRWFTRGWTLQELIAPAKVIFFAGSDWVEIGTKSTLLKAISSITGIQAPILENVREQTASYSTLLHE